MNNYNKLANKIIANSLDNTSSSQPYTYEHIFLVSKYVFRIITTYEARNTHAFSVSWSTGPIHPFTKTQEVFLGFLGFFSA